jgi:5-methylcytosine-specific restriction endonuclease McrA
MSNKNGGKWIRPEKRLAIYLRDGFECIYCTKDLMVTKPNEITLDHVVARNNGGGNETTNLVTACNNCNSSRQDTLVEKYASKEALERIEVKRFTVLNIELAKAIMNGLAKNDAVEALK